MTEFQIKLLSANNKSALNLDSLKLFNNIKKEHVFTSVSDALDAIWEALTKNINPDNPEMMSGGDSFSPLFINTIDDALTSIVYEIYHQDTSDLLLSIQSLLMKFADTVDVYKPIHQNEDGRIPVLANKIKEFLTLIGIYGLDLTNRRSISICYYEIMLYLYTNKKIKSEKDVIKISYYMHLLDGIHTNPNSH